MNYIIKSPFTNIYQNLSLEQYLLEEKQENILLTYKNKDSVVIGRNQNPFTECNIKTIREKKINLARRISGGGAVYHDLENLNISFLENKDSYNLNKNINLILNTLNKFNIKASFENKLDLIINQKKISGNAFAHKKNRVLHHLTLLVNSNLNQLSINLKSPNLNIQSTSIPSRKAKVCNLNQENKNITTEKIINALIKNYQNLYKAKINSNFSEYTNKQSYKTIYKTQKSLEWIWGKTPKFTLILTEIINKENINLKLTIKEGKINKLEITGIKLSEKTKENICQNLKNKYLNYNNLVNSLTESIAENKTTNKKAINKLINKIKKAGI